MRPVITVFGKASQKVVATLEIEQEGEILMFFLMRKGLPIASSCAGEGVCKKCVINQDILSCQLTVADWLREFPQIPVEVSYL